MTLSKEVLQEVLIKAVTRSMRVNPYVPNDSKNKVNTLLNVQGTC